MTTHLITNTNSLISPSYFLTIHSAIEPKFCRNPNLMNIAYNSPHKDHRTSNHTISHTYKIINQTIKLTSFPYLKAT
ncbi:hypothetical protein VIGAN_02085200 [Vigna angularis var. angularis]|uniref:Uncharacterized protein n=1 Tax=Vigna angularis var. angularis TaxID=157739 RepID=A0A0S3RCB5_PHAAN|nr:hypothetical protein VIGAN_02085200 [Vigna angularis var. angularis]